jgi:hypothetical protein
MAVHSTPAGCLQNIRTVDDALSVRTNGTALYACDLFLQYIVLGCFPEERLPRGQRALRWKVATHFLGPLAAVALMLRHMASVGADTSKQRAFNLLRHLSCIATTQTSCPCPSEPWRTLSNRQRTYWPRSVGHHGRPDFRRGPRSAPALIQFASNASRC